jgi:hypothetical protein
MIAMIRVSSAQSNLENLIVGSNPTSPSYTVLLYSKNRYTRGRNSKRSVEFLLKG